MAGPAHWLEERNSVTLSRKDSADIRAQREAGALLGLKSSRQEHRSPGLLLAGHSKSGAAEGLGWPGT